MSSSCNGYRASPPVTVITQPLLGPPPRPLPQVSRRLARSRRCRPPRGALYRVCPGAIRISKVATTGYSGGGKPEQHNIDIIMLGVPAYPRLWACSVLP